MSFGARVSVSETGELTKEAGSIMNGALDAAMAPFTLLSAEEKYVSAQTAGAAALGYGLGGFMVGDRFGHKVPVLGGAQRN